MRAVGVIVLAALMMAPACATVAPGQDKALVNAERTLEVAFATIDGFLLAEYTNRAALEAVEPRVHEIAEELRSKAPDALKAARDCVDAYRTHRSQEAEATMETYLAVVEALARDAQVILLKWKGAAP